MILRSTAADGSQEIVGFAGINLGFAAQTDRGLMVPSVRNADKLSARELDAEIRRLTAVVRSSGYPRARGGHRADGPERNGLSAVIG